MTRKKDQKRPAHENTQFGAWNSTTEQRIRKCFGNAPSAYVVDMHRVINSIEEDKPMKRFTIRTLVLALTLVLLLCGAALALGNTFGVFDFLSRNNDFPEALSNNIQTDFAQTGGDLDRLTVHVRDAVSDGKAIFVVIEYKAKNPDDVVLLGKDAQTQEYTDSQSGREPNWQDLSMATDPIIVGNTLLLGEDGKAPFYDLKYQNSNTLVVSYMLEVNREAVPSGQLREITIQPQVFKKINNAWEVVDSGDITIQLEQGGEQQWPTMIADAPIDIASYRIYQFEMIGTDLATYITVDIRNNPEVDMTQLTDDMHHAELLNSNGDAFVSLRDMNGSNVGNVLTKPYYVCLPMDTLPDSVVLRLYRATGEVETVNLSLSKLN